jgi:ABC-2 type transport system ATP-binding protein
VNAVAEVRGVSKRYGDFTALDDVTLDLQENTIHGLLGRNGAGKTTLMRILTGQAFKDAGAVTVFGETPVENAGVLERISFIGESQAYPDHFQVRHVMTAAGLLYPRWDAAYAESLLDDFALPHRRRVTKLSRGMRSALGITVGLASRAPLTIFDEPYLGLDAVARQLFYDRLLADYAENPRTILLSTHLIDEVGDLLERVTVIEAGRILIDEDAETLRSRAVTVSGPTAAVAQFTEGREVLQVERMAAFSRATVADGRQASDAEHARRLGLDLEPVSLQDLVVRTTLGRGTTPGGGSGASRALPGDAAGPGAANHTTENPTGSTKGALR